MTGKVVIDVEGVSKFYRLGTIGGATLREDLTRWWAKTRGRPDPLLKIGEQDHGNREGENLWALRDVSFQVREGEVLGVIGRNGAGKSTLLKILSRITAPTSGRATIRGRVGSLLEVGTGFHPELTGRENVYLNGAILGMKRAEITRKMTEIVDFAEMARFIDTPVKRYSSGMTVRLAFAVAAHLEPEILVIDEVLAVGDIAFQERCVRKMDAVAQSGRTVIFVSHNMSTIGSLCQSGILMSSGRCERKGPIAAVIEAYKRENSLNASTIWRRPKGLRASELELHRLEIRSEHNGDANRSTFSTEEGLIVEMEIFLKERMRGLCIGFDLLGPHDEIILRSFDTDSVSAEVEGNDIGVHRKRCLIPGGLLNVGNHQVKARLGIHRVGWIEDCESSVQFRTERPSGGSPYLLGLDRLERPGAVSPILSWHSGKEI
ncbi:MAG: ABC transporter ATP-binding protein [Xanthomonadales bacterium]|nr:ABC transporter ATP-binding protein [Xanthomonadales bacterium]